MVQLFKSHHVTKRHNHLDGERPLETIMPQMWHYTYQGTKNYPFHQWQNHLGEIQKWFGNPLEGDIVEKFSVTTGIMQDLTTISLASETYTKIRARQGFRYCSPIMAPQYCTFNGLSIEEVILALVRGIIRGEAKYPDIEVDLMLGVGREVEPEIAVKIVEAFANFIKMFPQYDGYIAGTTLVCDEAKYPPERHRQMYVRINELPELKNKLTACHAGERVHQKGEKPDFKKDLPKLLDNCWLAVEEFGVDILEHARPLAYDQALMKSVRDKGILVTSCPGSYICSELLPDNDVRVLKLDESLDYGINLCLDSDDDLPMMDIGQVFDLCHREYRFTEKQIKLLILNSWKKIRNRKPVPEDVVKLMSFT